jgi:DNA-binding transcriptional LysR family regulator
VFSFGNRAELVRSCMADAALLHSPRNDLSGLATEALVTEPQIVLLPCDHRLAHASQVRMDDLRGEQMPRWPGVADDGSTGPLISDAGHLMQLIMLKQIVAVVPASVAASLGADIIAVPVVDAPPTVLVLGWPEESRSAELSLFVRVATEVAGRNWLPHSLLAVD